MKQEFLTYFSKYFPPVMNNSTLTCKSICYFKKTTKTYIKKFSVKANNIKHNSDILSSIKDVMFGLADDLLNTASSQRVQVVQTAISHQ
jgi:hypothetical protein